MNPSNIPFNALIVGPANSGKSRFVADQIYGSFRGKFDYIVLVCQTSAHKTYHRIGENDPRMFILICAQHEVKSWLKLVGWYFEVANTLIILDDCPASKYVRGCTGQLVHLDRFFCSPCTLQRVDACPKADQHHSFLPRERGGHRSLLHTFGEDHEGHM